MNNSFRESIADICGLELATLCGGFKYSVFGMRVAVIEGHKGVAGYSDGEVSFVVAKTRLVVLGKRLRIKCLEKNFAVVVGQVEGVSVENNEK